MARQTDTTVEMLRTLMGYQRESKAPGAFNVMTGMMPIASDIRDVGEVITNKDMMTGEQLDPGARILQYLAAALPFISGGLMRMMGGAGKTGLSITDNVLGEMNTVGKKIAKKYGFSFGGVESKVRGGGNTAGYAMRKKGKVRMNTDALENPESFIYEKGWDAESSAWHTFAHELAHMKDPSHSKGFEKLTEQIYEDIKKIRGKHP